MDIRDGKRLGCCDWAGGALDTRKFCTQSVWFDRTDDTVGAAVAFALLPRVPGCLRLELDDAGSVEVRVWPLRGGQGIAAVQTLA